MGLLRTQFKLLKENVDTSSKNEDSTIISKATAMCVLFVVSMLLGTMPIKLSQKFKWKKDSKDNIYVILLLCLGGGVLLCTTFIHLLPEVAEGAEGLEEFKDLDIPVAELLMCAGFFMMYLLEEVVHVYLEGHHHDDNLEDFVRKSLSIRRSDVHKHFDLPVADSTAEHGRHSAKGHSHFGSAGENGFINSLRGLFVVLALSMHELFEGLSVGLESSAESVWYMFGAVAAHKSVLAFCVGVELVSNGLKTFWVIMYIFMFAVVSPLGIGIGLIVSATEHSSAELVSVILQGFATGTLLYVVFFEILQNERKGGLKNFVAVLIGFVFMLGITLLG